jgi:hypothetical protein
MGNSIQKIFIHIIEYFEKVKLKKLENKIKKEDNFIYK